MTITIITILICVACGRTEEFESEAVLEAGADAADRFGFKLLSSRLTVRGLCPSCAAIQGGDQRLTLAPFLEVKELWHRYASSDWTLQNIDFSLETGQLLGLLGPSGCGKTTLLRLIAGFERPSQGLIEIAGREVASPRRWLAPERRQVGMLFQDYALFPHLTAWQNACFGLKPNVLIAVEPSGFGAFGFERPRAALSHELSGGQRQRLALVRALVPQPQLLLLDEPFPTWMLMFAYVFALNFLGFEECGVTALMVTHDPEEAMAIVIKWLCFAMAFGTQCAPPQQLVAEPATSFVARFVLQANVLQRHDLLPSALTQQSPPS